MAFDTAFGTTRWRRNFRDAELSTGKSKLQLLCFAKTSDDFGGRQLAGQDRAENFEVIHDMGKKPSKYMPMQVKQVPAMDRTHTESYRRYDPRSMQEHTGTKMLTATFRPFCERRPVQKVRHQTSEYVDKFIDIGPEDLAMARSPEIAHKAVTKKVLQMSKGQGPTRSCSQSSYLDWHTVRSSGSHIPPNQLECGMSFLAGPEGLLSEYSATHSGSFWPSSTAHKHPHNELVLDVIRARAATAAPSTRRPRRRRSQA
mmetsp:Transcript_60286/g.111816  ORF Transcript_60286/g.111816 Transcript_60286/m.111816 type:complete len:257 (+) Transcript_60286:83-853(+)